MNFSEYTLISFGDSFTFGQDTIPDYIRQRHGQTEIQEKYKKECNEKSYTQVLCDRLGFKNSLNFGILAGSNERSLTLLESFLRSNPKKKVFVLFNFTSASRFLNIFQKTDEREYTTIDVYPNIDPEDKWRGITKKSIKTQYTYWRNSVQDVYNHIRDRRNLYYLLSSYDAPHVSFDIINNTDGCMLRDNPIKYIDTQEGAFNQYMHNDEDYIFKEMDFFNSYYQELVNNSPLLCHMGIKYFDGCPNLNNFFNLDRTYTTSNSHWNVNGHIKASKIIENFIKKEYDN